MNPLVTQVYNVVVPKFIRKRILLKSLPEEIIRYYGKRSDSITAEIKEVLEYLREHPLAIFPYRYQHRYQENDIEVFDDREKRLRYVIMDGKRLYFKRKWSAREIRRRYNWLLIEQDESSPHRYLTDRFSFEPGEVLIDVGAADGNFALSVVEKASRIVIFEPGREWIKPLQATFEPWKHKVQIIQKFVGDQTGDGKTTLDAVLAPAKDRTMFLKIDVEGAEASLLKGAKRILSAQTALKIIICTYHKQEDEEQFMNFFRKRDFDAVCSKGYMIFYHDKKIRAPYLRRGLIRAKKADN